MTRMIVRSGVGRGGGHGLEITGGAGHARNRKALIAGMARSHKNIAIAIALMTSTALALAATDDANVVRTESGAVRGFTANGAHEYRGIPFAAPPTGERRFTLPAPASPWGGVLDATRFGPACAQAARYGVTEASDDEDCLNLNIAVPAAKSERPRAVLVWFYGGAFVGGGSNLYLLDRLAREGDLVVVAGNYRVGAPGFLAHPALGGEADGALALEDQRALLRWVQRNIAAFGGDPANVTIAGESAGAASVCFQLATPSRSQGLFQRAIVMSAACTFRLRTREQAWETGRALAARLGCGDEATALDCLRRVPTHALVEAATTEAATNLLAFAPAVGSSALPRQPADAFHDGDFVRVPLLNGGLRDEMRLYIGYEVAAGARIDAAAYRARIEAVFGSNAPAVLSLYGIPRDDAAPAALGRLASDFVPGGGLHNCGFLRTAELAARQVDVFQYRFDDAAAPAVMPDPGFAMGAVHAAELAYLFPGFSSNTRYDAPPLVPQSQQLSAQMIAYWSAFARTGRPEVEGLPRWPPFSGGASVLRIDPGRVGVFDAAREHHCEFWRSRYPGELGI
jgi:para-nitrobenzyl esterase